VTGRIAARCEPASLATRLERFTDEIVELAARDGASAKIYTALRDCITDARIPRRVADGSEKGWTYEWEPDRGLQITAARTLAQILRMMPGDSGNASLSGAPGVGTMTTEAKLAELRALGLELRDIVDDITREVGPRKAIDCQASDAKSETPKA
jgi:hypothetical protein